MAREMRCHRSAVTVLHYVDPVKAEIEETRTYLIVSGRRRRVDDREYWRVIEALPGKSEPQEVDHRGDQSHGS